MADGAWRVRSAGSMWTDSTSTIDAPWTMAESHVSEPAAGDEGRTYPDPPPPGPAQGEDNATDVLRVCRHLLNTVDTRPRGHFWFSA